jgi:hypothetical protein
VQSRHTKPARPALTDAIQRLLELEAGGETPTSAQSVATATRLYEKLARHVAPVVGEAGFEALFSRSVKITKSTFVYLRELRTTGSAHEVLRQFFEHLEKQEPALVAAVTEALMATLVTTLCTFIGEGLTWQLLRNAWPDLPNQPSSEKTT